jgi:ABC-type phosphate transport system substrate-binding protein
LAFIQWVLADGQKYIDEVGYIQLSSDILEAAKEKIK